MTHIHSDDTSPSTKMARKIITAFILLFLLVTYLTNHVEFVNYEEEAEGKNDVDVEDDRPSKVKAKVKNTIEDEEVEVKGSKIASNKKESKGNDAS